ncbi:UDP-galactopyranose mutase [Frigidibacter sp. SD6-1]|uniref:UDP-galactopyranose mutase n=1 Tax=Frigidibacter sp. SD6-1 TaxID=3032581 RepID=UPI0032E8BFC0
MRKDRGIVRSDICHMTKCMVSVQPLATRMDHPRKSVTWQYPAAEGDPFCPVTPSENQSLHRRYRALADELEAVRVVGRPASYQYMNMDQVVAQSLAASARTDKALPRPMAPARCRRPETGTIPRAPG